MGIEDKITGFFKKKEEEPKAAAKAPAKAPAKAASKAPVSKTSSTSSGSKPNAEQQKTQFSAASTGMTPADMERAKIEQQKIANQLAGRKAEYPSEMLVKQDSNESQLSADSLDMEENNYVYQGIENDWDFDIMEADALIGGNNIADETEELSDQLTPEEREKVLKRQQEYANRVISFDNDDEEIDKVKEYGQAHHYNSSQKVFAFSMPMGANSNQTPMAVLNQVSEERKAELKEKLRRNESITSLEEFELYKDEKGINNSRTETVMKTFQVDGLKTSFAKMTMDADKKTHDGYSYARLLNIYDELEGDIVIMGGYRGSNLRDAQTGKRVWVPIKAGLNMTKASLVIGPKDEDEIETQKYLKPDGMLTHVGPVDISKKLIQKFASNPKVRIRDFGYDWRLSHDITAGHLAKFLQKIYDRQKEKKGIYLIAHSMGGLVAHRVLQEHTHLIRALVYVGSPSQCPNILGPIRYGDELMWNKTLLSKEANFFMRSSMHFLPFDGRCFVDKNTLERYDLDFFDVETWKEYGLSPLVNEKRRLYAEAHKDKPKEAFGPGSVVDAVTGTVGGTAKFLVNTLPGVSTKKKIRTDADEEDTQFFTASYEDSVDYLERTLKRTKKNLEALEYIPGKEYPPLAIVYGNRVPTVRGAKVSGREGIKAGEFGEFYYGPGDGVVHHKWLLPEQRGFPVVAKVATDCGHVALMTDFKAMAKAFISVVDAEKERAKAKGSA
ncbi:hypothetical protein RNJ44_01572 [Nakaseomyces bracarensis]|uniref:AB hydrolase-1 domain-containing protein n=1 Tax=Nakaseomyces bracarensis TaxID=273131 RepID=A0ABR4NQ37_9SACH